MNNEVSLVVNGESYAGWKSVQIVSGMAQTASQFACAITLDYPGGSTRIRPGDAVTVKIGSEVVMTGFVDSVPVDFDWQSVTVAINGRSKTADLVDCCIDTEIGQKDSTGSVDSWSDVKVKADGTKTESAPAASEWTGIDIKKTISRLCARYGVTLYDQTNKTYISKKVSVSKGTKVQDAILDLIKEFNLFVTDSPAGDLILSDTQIFGESGDTLVVALDGKDTNVLSGSAAFDYSDCYTQYEVFGQARPTDTDEPNAVYNVSGKQTSDALARDRILRIFESGDTTTEICQKRAKFEAEHRLAIAKKVVYKVAGWHQSDGELWRKGLAVQVHDELLGIDDRMLIESVVYDLSEDGTLATLSLTPIESSMGGYSSISERSNSIGDTAK